jgi:hypothetical protein
MTDNAEPDLPEGISGQDVNQRPSVEISRTASGKHTWRVRAYAADYTPDALTAARDLAVKLHGELAERLG